MMLLIIALMGLYSHLPPIQDVHKAALEYAQIDSVEAGKWRKRAKWSAALPKFQVDYSHRVKNVIDLNIDDNVYVGSGGVVVGPEEGGYSEGEDLYRSFGVRAIWSFDELIFKRDSLAVSEQALKVMKERNLLLDLVNKHYFEMKKLFSETKPNLREIGVERERAALDALTGGWFSQWMDEKGLPTEEKGTRIP